MEMFELQEILESVPEDKRNLFLMEYNSNKKDGTTAVLLAIFLGGFGAHHFYLGNAVLGVAYLLFSWTGVTYLIAWVEAFLLSNKVKQKNITFALEAATMINSQVNVKL